MFSYTSQLATTTDIIEAVSSDVLSTFLVLVGIVIGIAVLTVGVGFAWRKLRSVALGRKF